MTENPAWEAKEEGVYEERKRGRRRRNKR